MIALLYEAIDRGLVPEFLVRFGIRRLLAGRLKREQLASSEAQEARLREHLEAMRHSPIAPVPEKANQQHYEVPPRFFELVLGPHLKYSSGYWPPGVTTLDESEAMMLQLTCERARIQDGQEILELGCGWGALTLWMAERYPNATITAVSNSRDQRKFIEERASERKLTNVTIITADMNDFVPPAGSRFDRIISLEMFEHMRNYEMLLERIAAWAKPEGELFIHIFCHREFLYPFVDEGATDWMARHFFTGGLMPSFSVFASFDQHWAVTHQWRVSGVHYARTFAGWIARMDRHRDDIIALFEDVYGPGAGRRWFHRWRVFFLACLELFAYRDGTEWWVGHYRFALQPTPTQEPAWQSSPS